MKDIVIRGLSQNNLQDISIKIPKGKIVVFTGVSGSGKSSVVFDTIAAEAQRQMDETYPAFIRSRMTKHVRPRVDKLENLTPVIIVDQAPLGGNARSTVGTISELYNLLRLLFSRAGQPYAGTASHFSFNDPNGMCPVCSGIGKAASINMDAILIPERSWREGCVSDSSFKPGTWMWKQYAQSGLIDLDKPLKDYTKEERCLLLYGARTPDGQQEHPKVDGLFHRYNRLYLKRNINIMGKELQSKSAQLITEAECTSCHGKRLKQEVLRCRILGHSISDMCDMELTELYQVLEQVEDKQVSTLTAALLEGLRRLIEIGLPYLHLNRETTTLSGGEAQRVKLVRYMGSSLSGITYVFDEPSTGLHPRDVYRMNQLLKELRDKENTVLVVEHDPDVIAIADEIVDIGPLAGRNGGKVVFQGSFRELLKADTVTGKALRLEIPLKDKPREPKGFLPVRGAGLHNLKNVDVDIPLGVLTAVTGVAGSGKSTLITKVFAQQYKEETVMVDQSSITATNRSTPASFLGFLDEIRKEFALLNQVPEGMFSFNSTGACPVCKGKGVIVTELAYMDPVVNQCEACGGSRYSEEALAYKLEGKNIVEILSLTAAEAMDFFHNKKIAGPLRAMNDVGLSYMTLGQPLSTLSGGERQRMKLAKYIKQKGSIFILDEPTTGLHRSDTQKLMKLLDTLVKKGNTVILIEHNLDIVKQADWIIDIGPEGGRHGGQVVFTGTPAEILGCHTLTAECLRGS